MSLEPITRKEKFLAKAGGQDVTTPTPITREEMFLSKISGGGGVVQADYAINDPTADGYIKNRPCYAEEETISWDGSTEGLVTVPIGEGDGAETLVRISELTPTAEDLAGRALTVTINGETGDIPITADMIEEGENYRTIAGWELGIVADEAGEIPFGSEPLTVPSPGFYFVLEIATNAGITALSIDLGEVVHKLDPKFLPDDALTSINSVVVSNGGSGSFDKTTGTLTVNVPASVTDDHINSLIDAKLGVIENGAY